MSEATNPVDAGLRGVFLVGGKVKAVAPSGSLAAVRNQLSSLLQVKNLVILVGSGASFHLGSPRTRGLSNTDVIALIRAAEIETSEVDESLLAAISPDDNGNLEQLLNGLQLAIALAEQTAQDSISFGSAEKEQVFTRDQVEALRRRINRALAKACHLPMASATLEAPFDADPLCAHRTFLSRIVNGRRANLPRPRVFTTNYDLVIESALDQLGYPYIDGFSGTVNRRLNLAFYGLDFHRVETTTQSVVARAEGALYLYKVHGSLNWRSEVETDRLTGLASFEVYQDSSAASDEELVLIYPTAAKEGDSLAYPYSDLLRLLGDAVQQEDTAVLVVGYGFADPHINRLLLRSLATNPALNVFVADPYAVLADGDLSVIANEPEAIGKSFDDLDVTPLSTPISALAAGVDSRIAVLTGDFGKFSELAALLPGSETVSAPHLQDDITRLAGAMDFALRPGSELL